METWLRPNRRVLLLGLVPASLVAGLGALFLLLTDTTILRILGTGFLAIGVVLICGLLLQLRRPRIDYANGEVLFYLQARQPIATPAEVVEAFFVGQGLAELPGPGVGGAECVNLVARLSQRYPEWASRDVKLVLGSWEDGYATVRGAWCEPITQELVRRVNRRLREVHAELEAAKRKNAAT